MSADVLIHPAKTQILTNDSSFFLLTCARLSVVLRQIQCSHSLLQSIESHPLGMCKRVALVFHDDAKWRLRQADSYFLQETPTNRSVLVRSAPTPAVCRSVRVNCNACISIETRSWSEIPKAYGAANFTCKNVVKHEVLAPNFVFLDYLRTLTVSTATVRHCPYT